jgi:hypothetical protein
VRRVLLLVALALAGLSLAAPAGAVIVPQRSIAGVELLMTRAEVRGVLGEPNEVIHGTNEFGAFTVFKYRRLRVTFQGRTQVTAVATNRRNEKTARGIGFGSTRDEVRDNVRGVRCAKRMCVKGRLLPGRRVTVFRLYHGRVANTLVGFVID